MNAALPSESLALLERIKQAKRFNRVTIARIAEQAGMFRPTVTNQLNGKYNLDIRVVLAVARLCPDVSADYLLRGEGGILKNDSSAAVGDNSSCSILPADNILARMEIIEERMKRMEERMALAGSEPERFPSRESPPD